MSIRAFLVSLVAAFALLVHVPARSEAQAPKVRDLRLQKAGDATYFHLIMDPPADMRPLPKYYWPNYYWDPHQKLLYQPRLVPQDDRTRAVYLRWLEKESEAAPPIKMDQLEFVGKVRGDGPAKLLLLYPRKFKAGQAKEPLTIKHVVEQIGNWGEETIVLDLARAVKVQVRKTKLPVHLLVEPNYLPYSDAALWINGMPAKVKNDGRRTHVSAPLETGRTHVVHVKATWNAAAGQMTAERDLVVFPGTSMSLWINDRNEIEIEESASPLTENRDPGDGPWGPTRDDLAGMWAVGQMYHFAKLKWHAPQAGFHSFACEATGLKYGVAVNKSANFLSYKGDSYSPNELYGVAGGSNRLTSMERLAIYRLRDGCVDAKQEPRIVDLAGVTAITTAPYPWDQKLAGNKPAIEAVARLVPHDNYYVHCKNVAKFLETGDLAEQWSGGLTWFLNNKTNGYRLQERLEQQLCLQLAGNRMPAGVKGVALTGSDPYLREGSDLTVIFHVSDKALRQAAAESSLKEARQSAGGKLKEEKTTYQQVVIESFVSPLREISLYRAAVEDFVVYSNSPIGMNRVIDTFKGKIPSLAEARDFQHLRTMFRRDDPREDVLVYVPEAFIRKLLSPATRIKERRRLEALTSLSVVNNGALFTAWETGKLPTGHKELLAHTGLRAEQLFTPDSVSVWDPVHKLAVSPLYNTMNFATPLIEIPIDNVSVAEQRGYENFRKNYLDRDEQWDPVGVRIRLGDPGLSVWGEKTPGEVRLEFCHLPLQEKSQFASLKRMTNDGTIKFDPAGLGRKTIFQFMVHMSPKARESIGDRPFDVPAANWMGNWFTIQLDDSPELTRIVENDILQKLGKYVEPDRLPPDSLEPYARLPLIVGVKISNPLVFAGLLTAVRDMVLKELPMSEWEPMKEPYKETRLVQIKLRVAPILGSSGIDTLSLYYALVDGVFYISFREECIHDQIEAALSRKTNTGKEAPIEVNVGIHARAAVHAREALRLRLEWEANQSAIACNSLLHVLYRGGLLSPKDDVAAVRATAWKYLNLEPENLAGHSFDAKTDEVSHKRHGAVRQLRFQIGDDGSAPLARLLDEFQTVRTEVSFRNDGMFSVVRLRRK